MNFIKKIIASLENSTMPIYYFLALLFFFTCGRNFFELTLIEHYKGFNGALLLHYSLWNYCLAVSLIFVFSLFLHESVIKITKTIIPFFAIIVTVPFIDFVFNGFEGYGRNFSPAYLTPRTLHDAIMLYTSFFGKIEGGGVTPGIKIEVAIVIVLLFIYLYIKTKNLVRAIIGAILGYSIIFIYAILPFLSELFEKFFKVEGSFNNQAIINLLLIILFLSLFAISLVFYKKITIILLRDLRITRILHFLLMLILGVIVAAKQGLVSLNFLIILNGINLIISIVCGIYFCIVVNNIVDLDIDKISNQDRPLVKKKINLRQYEIIGWLLLLISLVYAATISANVFLLVAIFNGVYFIYSSPPLRLKKIPIFSKFLISFNSFILLYAGYCLAVKQPFFFNFPHEIMWYILLFGLPINFIDLKDYRGDKKNGILTLPTMIGMKNAQIIIGFSFIIFYLAAYTLIQRAFMLPLCAILGLIQFFIITKKNYDERYVFIVYLISIAVFCVLYYIL